MANTPPVQFRLSAETLDQIDQLASALGIPSRATVVRLAVARMFRKEIAATVATPTAKKASGRRKKSA